MARNAQVRRQWRIWRLLTASTKALSAEDLARSLVPDRVTSRTVRRDLEVLREVGVPVREERSGRQVRCWARGDGPDPRLAGETLLALRLALGLLRPFEGTAVPIRPECGSVSSAGMRASLASVLRRPRASSGRGAHRS